MKNFKKYLVLALCFGLSLNSLNANEYKRPFRDAIENQKKDDALKALIELHKNYPNNKDFPDKFKKAFNQTFEDALAQKTRFEELKEANRLLKTDDEDDIEEEASAQADMTLDDVKQQLEESLIDAYNNFNQNSNNESAIALLENIINAQESFININEEINTAKKAILLRNNSLTLAQALITLMQKTNTGRSYNPEMDKQISPNQQYSDDEDDDFPMFGQPQEEDKQQFNLGVLRGRAESEETITRLEQELAQAQASQAQGSSSSIVDQTDFDKEIAAERNQSAQLRTEISKVSQELRQAKMAEIKLKQQLKITQNDNTKQRKTIAKLNEQLEKLKNELAELSEKYSTLEEQVGDNN